MNQEDLRIAVIGLGYVGLPLAVEFGKKRDVIGFDIDPQRLHELSTGKDRTGEVTPEELSEASFLSVSSEVSDLKDANCYVVTVPTPIDQYKQPDLAPLREASRTVGSVLSKGDLVIYESTVYPGCTEEVCVPILEEQSGLAFNSGFFCGYSPERINPGDREHRLPNVKKITSGSTPEAAETVDDLYNQIVLAGTHKAESIKVAEAAKVIENIQRDVNIALINELAMIFERLNLDTEAVLDAAGSKWNFLPFRPGLVGGHCIGVDPYYLTHKAEAVGYRPEIILSGRRINDGMGTHVASQLLKALIEKSIPVEGARVLILGFAFKENCPDIRNTRVIDIVRELEAFHVQVDVYDPWVDPLEMERQYGIAPVVNIEDETYDAAVIAVAHDLFKPQSLAISEALKSTAVVYDLKYVLPRDQSDLRL